LVPFDPDRFPGAWVPPKQFESRFNAIRIDIQNPLIRP
jgi:hypothetical protein